MTETKRGVIAVNGDSRGFTVGPRTLAALRQFFGGIVKEAHWMVADVEALALEELGELLLTGLIEADTHATGEALLFQGQGVLVLTLVSGRKISLEGDKELAIWALDEEPLQEVSGPQDPGR